MEIHTAMTWRRGILAVIALAAVFALAASGGTQVPAEATAAVGVAAAPADNATGEDADDVPAVTAGTPKEGDVRGHRRILIVTYHVEKDCTVHANYPINPGDRIWVIRKGATIAWRYNVTSTIAAVSDPALANDFPHWGFVADSSCIGTSTGQNTFYEIYHNGQWVKKNISYPAGRPMPKRILSGRSQYEPHWRAVDWHPGHGAVPGAQRTLGHNRTLRDAPHRFVIGNVYAQWQVRPTSVHQDGYTKVYVPSLHRWGWLQL
jgi:hypothetical protein